MLMERETHWLTEEAKSSLSPKSTQPELETSHCIRLEPGSVENLITQRSTSFFCQTMYLFITTVYNAFNVICKADIRDRSVANQPADSFSTRCPDYISTLTKI